MCYHYVTVSTQRHSIQHKVHFTSCYIGCKYLRMCLYKGCQSITVATVKEIILTFCSVGWMQPGSQGNEINGFSFNGHSWLLEKQFSLRGWLRQQAGYWAIQRKNYNRKNRVLLYKISRVKCKDKRRVQQHPIMPVSHNYDWLVWSIFRHSESTLSNQIKSNQTKRNVVIYIICTLVCVSILFLWTVTLTENEFLNWFIKFVVTFSILAKKIKNRQHLTTFKTK